MPKFPVDAPKSRVIKALKRLGFELVREREHIAMVRENSESINLLITLDFFIGKAQFMKKQ